MTQVTIDKEAATNLGKWMARGAIDAAFTLLAAWVVAVLLISAALQLAGNRLHWSGRDNSDASFTVRSGLRLRTDHLNGCQYFESRAGALTPRLDQDGHQICLSRVKS